MGSTRGETSDVIRAMGGDHDAFAALANANVDRMYALARVIVRDADRAEDATQEALVRAWREAAAPSRSGSISSLAPTAPRQRLLRRGASDPEPIRGRPAQRPSAGDPG